MVIGAVLSCECRHCSSGLILEGTGSHCTSNIDDSAALVEQRLHKITRFYTILPYPVSNKRAHHGRAQKKLFLILELADGRKRQFWEHLL